MTQVEQIIADYFLSCKSLDDASASTVASRLAVSQASLSRFSKKCGYEGYRQFIFAFQNDLSNSPREVTKSALNVLGGYEALLTKSYQLLNEEQLTRVSSAMDHARRIFIIGTGSSGAASQEAAFRFMRIGMDARSIISGDLMRIQSVLCHENDLILGLSLSGTNTDVLQFLEEAHHRNAFTILMTNNPDPALQDICDEIIMVPSLENQHFGNVISPQFPLLLTLDLLYSACMALDDCRKKHTYFSTLIALDLQETKK